MRTSKMILQLIFCCIITLTTACKDDSKKALSTFEIASEYLNKELDKNATTFSIPVNTTLSLTEWSAESTATWVKTRPSSMSGNTSLSVSVDKNADSEKRTAQIKVTSSIRSYTVNITQYGANDVVIDEDMQIKPYGGKASEYQPGYDIDKSYDDKFTTGTSESHYHSSWNNTHFPVTLEYYFRGDTEMNYFIYYTRSGNGNFGEVEVYTATNAQRSDYTLQGKYDFQMKSTPSRIEFPSGVKATGVKFIVKSGLGDFVSCDEMQFFKKNTEKKLEQQLLEVFSDITCTELKVGGTEEAINNLPEYFVRIAQALKNNTYDEWEKNFRIRTYKAYSIPEEWSKKLMTKNYSNLDNPTGISVKAGDEVIVLVGDTYGNSISAQCIWEESSAEGVQTANSGDSYFLQTGVNKLIMKGQGQLFIMYNTDITASTAKPIKVHIPLGSGTVSGFFDLEEHKTDEKYKELLSKATHKYFCVRGNKIMFYFHRSKMTPSILSAINLWDDIIGWEQELMGIEDVRPTQVNNHIFAISPEYSYMWASDYRIAFVYTYLDNILLRENVMSAKDNAWGPAHEIGHLHQAAINWPSSTESSNNLFSNFVIYKLGKYGSRGDVLSSLATARFVDKRAWYNMGTSTHQNEDTEIHMRMNWQLWSYYHRCGYNTQFWPTLFKFLREDRIIESDPGTAQLKFAKMACKAANEDLTEFFEMWGFFEPVNNVTINQYGEFNYNVTTSMIQEAKEYMETFKKKAEPFYYLEDRRQTDFDIDNYKVGDVGHYDQFKNKVKITKTVTATVSGQQVSITNGSEAVAFEIRKNNQLIYFSNFLNFTVPSSISLTGATIYAVQVDGERIEIKRN